MAEAEYDENGFREDLKNSKDVLHQPDADRSAWDLTVLDYDQTMDVLNGKLAVKPNFSFADDVLNKIREEKLQIDSDEDLNSVIEDKYQQILLARYNEDQAKNVSRKVTKDDDE